MGRDEGVWVCARALVRARMCVCSHFVRRLVGGWGVGGTGSVDTECHRVRGGESARARFEACAGVAGHARADLVTPGKFNEVCVNDYSMYEATLATRTMLEPSRRSEVECSFWRCERFSSW